MKMRHMISVILILWLVGCKSPTHETNSFQMEAVFSQFEYAGTIQSLSQLGSVTPEHEAEMPKQYEPGLKYVFYHRLPLKNSEMEIVTIPSRLSAHGFQFKPLTESDLMYPDEGGPLFTLDFTGACTGNITNVVDRRIIRDHALSGLWASEAYIVEFRNAGCPRSRF